MQIAYGENIMYEAETADFLQLQKVTASVALRLIRENENGIGKILLETPNNVNLRYNLNNGEVTLESKIGNVNNTFSPELEAQIVQPIREAISLIAKYELLKRLAVAGTDDIKAIVKKNHPNLDDPEKNLGKINITLASINLTRRSPSLFGLFSNTNINSNKSNIADKAIAALAKGEIRHKADVERIFEQQQGIKSAPIPFRR